MGAKDMAPARSHSAQGLMTPAVQRSVFPYKFQTPATDPKDEWNLVTPSPTAVVVRPKKPKISKKTRRVHPSDFIDNLDDAKALEEEDNADKDLDPANVFPSSAFFNAASVSPDSDNDGGVTEATAAQTQSLNDSFGMKFAVPSTPRVFGASPANQQKVTKFEVIDAEPRPTSIFYSPPKTMDAETITAPTKEEAIAEIETSSFSGLDVSSWEDWEHCVEFMDDGGLIIAEVYSKAFGPSEAMYDIIGDIIRRKAQNMSVEFVRLSLQSLKGIEPVREAIVDYDRYTATPIPLYFFLKHGKKVGQLDGTKPYELGVLIDRFASMEQPRDQTYTAPTVPVRYSSILATKRTRTKMLPDIKETDDLPWCDGVT